MPDCPPENPAEFLHDGLQIWRDIESVKQRTSGVAWYPYQSLSSIAIVVDLIGPYFAEIMESMNGRPVLDIGCGDGDYSFLFATWGFSVEAVDCRSTNFNQLKGIERMAGELQLPIQITELDLNECVKFSHTHFGLTLFLGTLYHLKNPYQTLERLAYSTRWCILSTRVAQVTPGSRSIIENEPVAYLVNGVELQNDATNYWIFSAAGLLRILQRTRWAIVSTRRNGCPTDSDPVSPNADERIFVLLQSRVFFPGLRVRGGDGLYPSEGEWRWTQKKFSLHAVLPLEQHFSSFTLGMHIPPPLIAGGNRLTVHASIRDCAAGSASYETDGPVTFQGQLPLAALHDPTLRIDFTIESAFQPSGGDHRPLGICLPLTGSAGHTDFLDFAVR